jgi:hypothetical protein
MRYSRMLEESSFANKRADYFWLLLLSSIMLLVKTFPDICQEDSELTSISALMLMPAF